MISQLKFQIGKNGVTSGTIEFLENALKTHKQIRISTLKSSGRDRDSIKTMAEKIVSELKTKCDYKIIGFTIILVRKAKQ